MENLINMNDYNHEILRKRHRNLIIVEGEKEENKLFQIIFQTFPEIDISIDDILIYGTNIYVLYNDIIKEYGEMWFEDDVDLPFIVGKKKGYSKTLNVKDFSNVYLVFDYERHDPNFCEQKIEQMQRYFYDSADMGKLYINYPMLESYQHFSCLPDSNYENLTVDVTLQPGSQYKKIVCNSFINKLVHIPHKIERLLFKYYDIRDIETCKLYAKNILDISSSKDIPGQINRILSGYLIPSELNRAINHLNNLLECFEHIKSNMSYYEYMRYVFKQIIIHNINKGSKILKISMDKNDSETIFELLDLNEILKEQNVVSKDETCGFIWVLNTCVFLIPDYNFKLID